MRFMNPRKSKFLLDELLRDSPEDMPDLDWEAIPRIIADEPMRWFYEESEQETWEEQEEFLNVAPVYPAVWIEFSSPRYINSEVFGIVPFPHEFPNRYAAFMTYHEGADKDRFCRKYEVNFPEARWVLFVMIFVSGNSEFGPAGHKFDFLLGVSPEGRLVTSRDGGGFIGSPAKTMVYYIDRVALQHLRLASDPQAVMNLRAEVELDPAALEATRALEHVEHIRAGGDPHEIVAMGLQYNFFNSVRVALLATYFMHARGASLEPNRVPPKVADARRRRGEPTGTKYKILDIGLPARQSLRDAKAQGKGSKAALRMHLRRGHFATYGPEKPHVSGFVGTMYRRPAVVKPEAKGTVEKDYRPRGDAARAERKKRKRKRRRGKR